MGNIPLERDKLQGKECDKEKGLEGQNTKDRIRRRAILGGSYVKGLAGAGTEGWATQGQ